MRASDDAARATTMSNSEILCVGEVLWDALPAGLFLGGAPFNVACHLRAAGRTVSMVSRVGADRLGEEVLRRAPWYGVGADLIQVDAELPTGLVRVNVDERGNAEYEILEPAAWDAIALDGSLVRRAEAAGAIVFGTVAQRRSRTRATLEKLWESDALMVFDANLRPPYDDREVVRRSLSSADIVKVSERELARIADWFGLRGDVRAQAAALAEEFECGTVCVTRGREGAALWRDGRWTEEPGVRSRRARHRGRGRRVPGARPCRSPRRRRRSGHSASCESHRRVCRDPVRCGPARPTRRHIAAAARRPVATFPTPLARSMTARPPDGLQRRDESLADR